MGLSEEIYFTPDLACILHKLPAIFILTYEIKNNARKYCQLVLFALENHDLINFQYKWLLFAYKSGENYLLIPITVPFVHLPQCVTESRISSFQVYINAHIILDILVIYCYLIFEMFFLPWK